jgi:hypothetical protein
MRQTEEAFLFFSSETDKEPMANEGGSWREKKASHCFFRALADFVWVASPLFKAKRGEGEL